MCMAKILWIEDEFNAVGALMILLREKGVEVVKARSKKEAFKKLDLKYDLIILDLILPQELPEDFEHFVGLSILRHIKNRVQTPIVVYSIVKEPEIANELELYKIPFYYKGDTDIVEFRDEIMNLVGTSD